jgi:hypothetical protein
MIGIYKLSSKVIIVGDYRPAASSTRPHEFYYRNMQKISHFLTFIGLAEPGHLK